MRQDLIPHYGDFINAALYDLQTIRSWLCMRWRRQFVIPAGQTSVSLNSPDGRFKEFVHSRHSVYLVGEGGALLPVDVVYEAAERKRVATFGAPTQLRVFLTWDAAEPRLNVAQAPTQDLTFRVLYYRYLPELVNDTDSNWFTEANRWPVLLTRAKYHAFSYVNDLQAAVAASDAAVNALGLAGAESVALGAGQLGKTHLPLLEANFNMLLNMLIKQEAASSGRGAVSNM